MSKPKKLIKKMIIAVFCRDADWSNNAKVGIFIDNLLEEPAYEFSQNETRDELKIVEKVKELATDNYRWRIQISKEERILLLENSKIAILNPEPDLNASSLLYAIYTAL